MGSNFAFHKTNLDEVRFEENLSCKIFVLRSSAQLEKKPSCQIVQYPQKFFSIHRCFPN